MEITTEDAKTLAAMLGNTLGTGWSIRVEARRPDGSGSFTREVQFLRMDGNAIRVTNGELLADDTPYSIPLEDVEAVHIY